ncbi:MAG: tRNA pseudouridine(38-40) synthase TruA [Dehalococcoidia bacterium]
MNGNAEASARRIALLLEYDGTAYGGSQYQKNAPTVQGTLERALSRLTSEPIRVSMAGRTDAGVHAVGQVASFKTSSKFTPGKFAGGGNALLPGDITIRAAAETPLDFDPRRQAKSRLYRYTIDLRSPRSALLRNVTWHLRNGVDLQAMEAAAGSLAGIHDFAAFTPPSVASRTVTNRCIQRVEWSTRGGLAFFDIEANAFLMHMVRRIVGTLVEVGRGRLAVDDFKKLVEQAPPGEGSRTAPARGLCLIKVRYESGLFDDDTNEDI